jgi:type II secretory pathway component GspD/PulD (secretin)
MKPVILALALFASVSTACSAQDKAPTAAGEVTIVAIKALHVPPSLLAHSLAPPSYAEGVDAIVASEATGELWVRGTAQGIASTRQVIEFLDQPLRRVELRLRTVRVAKTDTARLGIDFAHNGADKNPGVPAFGFMRHDQNGIEAVLRELVEERGAMEMLDSRLTIVNNTSATVQTSFAPQISTALRTIVTPTINHDRTVTISMETHSSAPPTGKHASEPGTSKLQSVMNTRDGETIVTVAGNADPEFATMTFVTARILPPAAEVAIPKDKK